MLAALQQALITTLIGLVYWTVFSVIVATKEPWDGAFYWSVAYPGSIVIATVLGSVFRRRAWITGFSLTFAQLPIMMVNTGIGPLTLFGVAILGILSIPVTLAAVMIVWLRA